MKILLCFLFCFITSALFGQTVPAEPVNLWHIITVFVIPILAGLWEVIVRIIPTTANWSWIQKVIEILLWISTKFNRKKK
jgi:hypothetical protein